MSDLELLLNAYLGSENAQLISAEMGKGLAEQGYLIGVRDMLELFTRESASQGRLMALREIGKDWIDLAEEYELKS